MLKNVLIKLVFLLGVTLSAYAQKRLPDVFIGNLQRQNVSATEMPN
jgi:hypothetical protein